MLRVLSVKESAEERRASDPKFKLKCNVPTFVIRAV